MVSTMDVLSVVRQRGCSTHGRPSLFSILFFFCDTSPPLRVLSFFPSFLLSSFVSLLFLLSFFPSFFLRVRRCGPGGRTQADRLRRVELRHAAVRLPHARHRNVVLEFYGTFTTTEVLHRLYTLPPSYSLPHSSIVHA